MIEIKRSGGKISLVDQGDFSGRFDLVYVKMSRFGVHSCCKSDRAIVKRSGFAVSAKCASCGRELMREPKIIVTQDQLLSPPVANTTHRQVPETIAETFNRNFRRSILVLLYKDSPGSV
jgi:hypothetical protein